MRLKWKICGMREENNIKSILDLEPDYMGFIFYSKSPRYVAMNHLKFEGLDFRKTKKVGVFVNERADTVMQYQKELGLDLVQLHGNEPAQEVEYIRKEGVPVIKAISVQNKYPDQEVKQYEDVVDYFLFDTKTDNYGGSGKKFSWELLNEYSSDKPFFISGGIDYESLVEISERKFERLHAVDLNSRFEVSPGLKDLQLLKKIKEI